jgi:hypothetical protein
MTEKKKSQTQGRIDVIKDKTPTIKILGTRETLGEDFPKELKCFNECDGGDVCVDTETGLCSICGLKHNIEETEVIVEETEEIVKELRKLKSS